MSILRIACKVILLGFGIVLHHNGIPGGGIMIGMGVGWIAADQEDDL